MNFLKDLFFTGNRSTNSDFKINILGNKKFITKVEKEKIEQIVLDGITRGLTRKEISAEISLMLSNANAGKYINVGVYQRGYTIDILI